MTNFITMNKIGMKGRLGNQLYQIFCLVYLSKKYNINIKLPKNNKDFDIYNTFKIRFEELNSNDFLTYKEIDYYNLNLVENFVKNNLNHNINLYGWFQEIKEPKLLDNLFIFNDDINKYCSNYINKLNENKKYKITAIHIRLGDYLNKKFNDIYNNLLHWKNYLLKYKFIIKNIKKKYSNSKFLIISDDINKCKELLKNIDDLIYINLNPKFKHQDLCIMSKCNNFILSNSTYGIWGVYLCENNNCDIYIPNNYFVNQCKFIRYNNIYLDNITTTFTHKKYNCFIINTNKEINNSNNLNDFIINKNID